jgi:lysophospholipid acyltransferase (LPLAT)-like uncharacterized protein
MKKFYKPLFKRLFKSAFFNWLMVSFVANYIRVAYWTSRKRMDMDPQTRIYLEGREPAVFAFWHGRMLLIPMICPPRRKIHVLISTHRDGEMIARTMHRFGFGTVRGSSTRGGATAGMQAVKALQAGDSVAVTPDGPKGPVMKVQPGLLTIAEMAGVPVIPVTYASTRCRRMKSWDRFMVALPFGTVYYKVGAPMVGAKQEALEDIMVRMTQEVDSKAGAQ